MKFTVIFVAFLGVTTSLAVKVKNTDDKRGDKREAALGYGSSGYSSHYPTASLGPEDASSISIGAGYSVGGVKPSFSYAAAESGHSFQFSPQQLQSGGGHATIQLAPITLQPTHGGAISQSELHQLMSQISHGLSTGQLSLAPSDGHSLQGDQQYQQYSFGAPQLQLTEQPVSSVPHYAAGHKGLGSYSSTGPVLFNPSDSQSSQATLTYAPSSGHSAHETITLPQGSTHSFPGLSLGGSGHSFGGQQAHSLSGSGHAFGGLQGHSLSDSAHFVGGGHSLGAHSLGTSGHSLIGSGNSLGGSGHSLGGSGHSLGGSGHSYGGLSFGKSLGGGYIVPSKMSFKPSYISSASLHGDSSHGLSSFSGSHGAPSLSSSFPSTHGGLSLSSGGHYAPSFGGDFGSGSSKFIAPSYPKSEGFSASLDSSSFSSGEHSASPPGTTYGIPSSSHGSSTAAHAASSYTPQYYVTSSKHSSPSSFGSASSSHRAPSSHSSMSSFSSGPKYIFSSHGPSTRYSSPKDSHGAHSETSYNTIKYSAELKPRMH